jgi:hypothetical protein
LEVVIKAGGAGGCDLEEVISAGASCEDAACEEEAGGFGESSSVTGLACCNSSVLSSPQGMRIGEGHGGGSSSGLGTSCTSAPGGTSGTASSQDIAKKSSMAVTASKCRPSKLAT